MRVPAMLKQFSLLLLLSLPAMLAGCGGSGGTSGGTGDTVTVGSSNMTVAMGQTTLQLSTPTTVTATIRKTDGSAASGTPVTFATSIGTVAATAGATTATSSVTVNADSMGVAKATLNSGTTAGPGQLSVSATVDGKLLTTTKPFEVSLPALRLTNLKLTNNAGGTISYGSSQGITVDVVDAATGLPYTAQPVSVVFSSTFQGQNKAKISSPVATVNGTAATTYTAGTAVGTDTITASVSGSTQTVALTITSLDAGAISFVSATPSTIGLQGMGGVGAQEFATVTFKVVDTSGAPKKNQAVTFALNTNVGGLRLSAPSGSTGEDGTVSTIVQSGIVATPVRVTASTVVGGRTISTQSDQLVVSTGVPAQDGFSLSIQNMNPESFNTDGVTTMVTARLSDHFHNPVPDGTAVSFTTSGGTIEPSCTTVKGSCSVTWTSQDPRPTPATGAMRTGRAVILAYAIGEEGFKDLNGNGVADPGEFQDNSDPYRDDNESGTYQAGQETYYPFTGSSFNAGDGKYNGLLQGTASAGAPKSKYVFKNSVIVMATSEAAVTVTNAANAVITSITAPGSFKVTVRDGNGNTMPSGTKVAVKAPFGVLSGATSYTFPQNVGEGVTLPFAIAATTAPKPQPAGFVTIDVTAPSGLVTTYYLPISGDF